MPGSECDYYGSDDGIARDEELQKVSYDANAGIGTSPTPSTLSTASLPPRNPVDPGLAVLLPQHGELRIINSHSESPTESHPGVDQTMTDAPDIPRTAGETTQVDAHKRGPEVVATSRSGSPPVGATNPQAKTQDLAEGLRAATGPESNSRELATRVRVDSGQESDMKSLGETAAQKAGLGSPLKLQTSGPEASATQPRNSQNQDSITASPTLSRHTMTAAEGKGDNLAPYEPTSPSATSPERLPSIRQLTGSLTELAEAATQELRPQQAYSHKHSQSFGSAPSHSPIMSTHPYPASIHASPQAYYPPSLSGRSPTSTISEGHHYGPPSAGYQTYGMFPHRRPSTAFDHTPQHPPSLPSASSSGESYGNLGSSADGYSTNTTTPIDSSAASDCTIRPPMPMLPPPPGMNVPPPPMMIPGPFKCDVPDCTALSFQTQYLLSSHKNVHSQSRPHYCPVEGCTRSEGGRGFKRKNEMIRHGLVHNSPGYICPFCPEREHRYPRPDNLQRHVRVHHVDKDRDDPVLREVLAQRSEGQGKTRRRRTGTAF